MNSSAGNAGIGSKFLPAYPERRKPFALNVEAPTFGRRIRLFIWVEICSDPQSVLRRVPANVPRVLEPAKHPPERRVLWFEQQMDFFMFYRSAHDSRHGFWNDSLEKA